MKTITKYERILPEERETHLNYDPIDGLWYLESNIPRHFNKAVRTGWSVVEQTVYTDGTICAMRLTAPERGITIKSPEPRHITEDHKSKLIASKKHSIEMQSNNE